MMILNPGLLMCQRMMLTSLSTAQQENENEKKKTMYDLNTAIKFLREVRKEERELEKISP